MNGFPSLIGGMKSLCIAKKWIDVVESEAPSNFSVNTREKLQNIWTVCRHPNYTGLVCALQERSKRLEIRREGERKRREKEEAEIETRRLEAEERARLKVRKVYVYVRCTGESLLCCPFLRGLSNCVANQETNHVMMTRHRNPTHKENNTVCGSP